MRRSIRPRKKRTSRSGKRKNNKPIKVVLDLDNTLIYSWDYPKFDKEKLGKHYICYNMDEDYMVCERPGLQPFLTWLFQNFEVMVWSAASPDYVDFIVKKIVIGNHKNRKVQHIFNSEKCDESQEKYNGDTKNLNLLWDTYDFEGYGPYNVLIIDDMGHVIKSQPSRSIRIKKFVANEKSIGDNDFDRIKKILKKILVRFNETEKDPSYRLVTTSDIDV